MGGSFPTTRTVPSTNWYVPGARCKCCPRQVVLKDAVVHESGIKNMAASIHTNSFLRYTNEHSSHSSIGWMIRNAQDILILS